MRDIVYITGHKNPDTDSICAAIAYAEFKRKSGYNAIPVRLGSINRETKFVLKYFNVEVPVYLSTVKTQVNDLNIDVIPPSSPDITIKAAWIKMKKENTKVIPIVDDKERLLGIATLSDITNKYMDTSEESMLATSKAPLKNIVETVNAKVLCGTEQDFKTTGRVIVADLTPKKIQSFVHEGDIVIVGNKKAIQLKALELGANCIIITCGGRADSDVLAFAKQHRCIVMTTENDSFMTARTINQSIPIGFTMTTKNLIYFNTDDFIDEIKDTILQTRFRSYPVVDSNHKIKGFISRYHLISQRKKKVILLDHNERAQTVDGIEQAEILEIIDHHRVGDIQTGYPICFKNEPVGSTSTIIANLYFDTQTELPKVTAGILCAAIISDTIKFKSPTSTPIDYEAALKLAKIADINIDEFAALMFREGSSLYGKSPEDIIYNDFKEFHLGKYKIGIGQINTVDRNSVHTMSDLIIQYMREICKNQDYNLIMLMVTDLIDEGSEILFVGKDKGLIAKAFQIPIEGNSVYLKGVVSRKKQVVPFLAAISE